MKKSYIVIKGSQFHYGSIQIEKIKNRFNAVNHVSIPLWFDSNERQLQEPVELKNLSQSHYGSIQMKTNPFDKFIKGESQFHYGSIQILKDQINKKACITKSQFHYGSIQIVLFDIHSIQH